MSITSVSNRWLNRVYKILAILLVCIAVLISAFRLLLPYVSHYRDDFQSYINESNQTNIEIGSLGMSWKRWGPTIVTNQVTFIDTVDAYVYIDHLEAEIDFFRSITQQRLVLSNINLEGAKFKLADGIWSKSSVDKAENFPKKKGNNDASGFEQITAIFLNRVKQFSLRNSHINIYNKSVNRNFHISNLSWSNIGSRHQAEGNVIADELSANNLSLKIDVKGDSVDELNGVMYVEANHLDITPWLDSVLALDNDKTKGDISFSTWFTINQGAIESLQVSLAKNQISWIDKNGKQNLSLSAGQLIFFKGDKQGDFKLFSTPLVMQFNQQPEQEFFAQLNKQSEDISVYLSSFDLALISQVSPLFIHDENTRALLSQLSVDGNAHDIYFKKNKTDIQALANFTHASTKYSYGIPGIDNLSGQLSFNEDHLNLNITAEDGALDFKHHFVAPILYSTLNAEIELNFLTGEAGKSGWQLAVNDIDVVSPELWLQADFSMDAFSTDEITMSLLASISDGDASKAGHYFPLTSMSESLVNYLNNAIVSGDIKQAQVLINGPMSHFPFADGSGIFVVDAELENALFNFDDDWANIVDFSANLNFTNNSMLITGRKGTLSGLSVNGVQAAIDDLAHQQVLTVDTLIKPSSANLVAALIEQSPLKHSVGSVLSQLQLSGDINGEFHLNLPLNQTDNVIASGLINFNDNQMALQTPRMNFAQVNGQLSFSNDHISTKDLSLNWLGMPLSLEVKGQDKDDYYDTDIALTANWQEQQWQPNVSPLLKQYLDHSLQWQGDLSLFQHHDGGFSYQFDITSDLESTQSNLPLPYKKTVGDKVPFTVKATGQLTNTTINANYGEKLSFFGVLDHQKNHFERAHLVLGDEKMLLPMNGFHITTNLTQVKFADWQPLISNILEAASSHESIQEASQEKNIAQQHSSTLFSKPERIRGTIEQLDILGQQLHNISFNLLDKQNWWLLQLDAKETRSSIKFYPDWLSQGIDVNADFIHFTAANIADPDVVQTVDDLSSKEVVSDDYFEQVPKINLHCDRCSIDKLNLGEVDLSLSRVDQNAIKIDRFSAKRQQGQMNMLGQWQKNRQGSITDIHGDIALKDIEYELEQLGYGSIIRDSGGKLTFALNWQGGPQHFDFADLNGDINIRIDDGYLSEVSDKARIFSVLSLDSLVRKLTLDFRDIFSDGMFYSNIKGDYHFKNGVLYTDNTRMNGTAGDLFIKGNTDFVNNLLDYKMSYKPNLTSSLPVLAWVATLNPVVFLAGVAIDQVITSKVISEFNFELTGSVQSPNFKEVNRKSRNISVGRSKPPEFVDTPSKNKSNDEQPKSFKQPKVEDLQQEVDGINHG